MKRLILILLAAFSLMFGSVAPAVADVSDEESQDIIFIGNAQNQPMLEEAIFPLGITRSTSASAGVKVYGWPQIDSIHAPSSKYVSVHGWWTADRADLRNTKAEVTSILMVKKWYGYSHIGTSNTSSATRKILPNQTSKRSHARADCKDGATNTFWAMTILRGAGSIKEGTKSNAPVTRSCTPK